MNMTHVLHRRKSVGIADVLPSAPDFVPPSLIPPDSDDRPSAPWPSGAKNVVVLLAVATVLATVVALVGLTSGDDGAAERQLQDRIDSVTSEREDAVAAAATLDSQIAIVRQELLDARAAGDASSDRVDELVTQVGVLSDQRAAATAAADEATASLAEATTSLAEATTSLAEANASLGEALVTADDLRAAVTTERERLAAALAERDALSGLFPVDLARWLNEADTIGSYRVKFTQVYCAGLATCATSPTFSEVTIRKTAKGNLVVTGPGLAEAGLFRANGALHAVAGVSGAVPACDGTARASSAAITLFPGRYDITKSGARQLAGLTGSIVIDSSAVGNCPAALAFYSAQLTPKS